MQATKHASEGSTLALKPRAGNTRNPKQGFQWLHKKDLCPSRIFFSKIKNYTAVMNERLERYRFPHSYRMEKWALQVMKAINNFIHIDESFAICMFVICKCTV